MERIIDDQVNFINKHSKIKISKAMWRRIGGLSPVERMVLVNAKRALNQANNLLSAIPPEEREKTPSKEVKTKILDILTTPEP
eukprot:4546646-Amphidinium_carterae.1